MAGSDWATAAIWFFNFAILLYFLGLNGSYCALLIIAYRHILVYRRLISNEPWRRIIQSPLTIPISILAPAYNEEQSIVESVYSLMALEYPQHEVIVVNDGSSDRTLETLIVHFALTRIPIQVEYAIACQPIRGVYRSAEYPVLVVVDKENGGKADALNAGINIAKFPLVCAIDADSVLEGNALLRVVRPFLERPAETIAVGGVIRIANGCRVAHGQVLEVGLPDNAVAMFQSVEYLRAFLFGRSGWSALGALLLISGAFGIFKRQVVIDVGGYRHDTVGEDIELVVRMHRYFRERRVPYRVEFLPDPVCWTEAPESLRVLGRQRNRWHRGLIDTFKLHHTLLLNPRYGVIGMVAMPYALLFELFGPLVELFGYLFVPLSYSLGFLNAPFMLLFVLVAILLGSALSVASVLLDELSFRRFPKAGQLFRLIWYGLLENFGYRQLTAWWRVKAFVDYLRGNKTWGKMERKGFAKPKA
jgi:cellulose synthase/poly-beta-1,6-N-acetylglucosamine synthase-like glycosyltransferase